MSLGILSIRKVSRPNKVLNGIFNRNWPKRGQRGKDDIRTKADNMEAVVNSQILRPFR